MEELRAARALVSGRVQGVFFRQSTAEAARARGLAGWVRNLTDGRVEVHVEGPADAVEVLLAWCRRGPPAAKVDEVTVRWLEPEGLRPPFEVRH